MYPKPLLQPISSLYCDLARPVHRFTGGELAAGCSVPRTTSRRARIAMGATAPQPAAATRLLPPAACRPPPACQPHGRPSQVPLTLMQLPLKTSSTWVGRQAVQVMALVQDWHPGTRHLTQRAVVGVRRTAPYPLAQAAQLAGWVRQAVQWGSCEAWVGGRAGEGEALGVQGAAAALPCTHSGSPFKGAPPVAGSPRGRAGHSGGLLLPGVLPARRPAGRRALSTHSALDLAGG